MDERVKKALGFAVQFGGIDGAHHKTWVIDQMVRALTGCPIMAKTVKSGLMEYTVESQGESDEYKALIASSCDGDDGPNTYDWDVGIAP